MNFGKEVGRIHNATVEQIGEMAARKVAAPNESKSVRDTNGYGLGGFGRIKHRLKPLSLIHI